MKIALGTITLLAAALAAVPATAAAPTAERSACTVTGTSAYDVLVGTPGPDVICGRGGPDLIRGLGGADIVYGGAGADRLQGGPGADVLHGQDGDDACAHHELDTATSCHWDATAPEVAGFAELPPGIDVSTGAQTVTLRVHLVDDAGVVRVQGFLHDQHVEGAEMYQQMYERVSGTIRDGWWEITETIPAGFPVSDLEWDVSVTDVLDRGLNSDPLDVLHVDDANPDPLPPRVSILSPSAAKTYDVRTQNRTVIVEARVVDPETGVAPQYLQICAERLLCDEHPTRVSGNKYDGIWRGKLLIPRGTPTGDLSFHVYATDRARPDAYIGHFADPDYLLQRYLTSGGAPEHHLLAGGFTHRVIGPEKDQPPLFDSLAMTPSAVVRSADGSPVEFAVEAAGATDVEVLLFHEGESGPLLRRIPLALEGAVWTATWLVKDTEGYRLGDYHPIVRVADAAHAWPGRGHTRYYASAGANTLIGTAFPELAGDPVLTVSDPE